MLRCHSLICSLGSPDNPLPPTQSLESVVGGVLAGFAERRDIERAVDECVDSLIATKGSMADVNQLSRDIAPDVNPKQRTVISSEDQLDQTLRRPP
jgi:hypothetical protein